MKLTSLKELPFDLEEYVRYNCFSDSATLYQVFSMGRNAEDRVITREGIVDDLIHFSLEKLSKQFSFLKKRYEKYINDPKGFVDGVEHEVKFMTQLIINDEKMILEERNSQTYDEEIQDGQYEGDGTINKSITVTFPDGLKKTFASDKEYHEFENGNEDLDNYPYVEICQSNFE